MSSPGRLDLIIGCMFSGKTKELIRYTERHVAIGRRVLVINHTSDKKRSIELARLMVYADTDDDDDGRDESDGLCASHSGSQCSCMYMQLLNEKHPRVAKAHVVGVNEAQFFDEANLEQFVLSLIRQGKQVIVSGLDADFKRKPFLGITNLIPHATTLVKLKALCAICRDGKTTAIYSLKKTPKTSHQSHDRIQIGASNLYTPVCFRCYESSSSSQ